MGGLVALAQQELGHPIKAYSDVEIISELLDRFKVSTESEIS